MKILTGVVLVVSVVMMGFGIYMVAYADDTKAIALDKVDRPPCYSVFPAYISFLGILGMIVAIMGIPAYFGNKIHDECTLLVLLSIHCLWLIVMAVHVTKLGNFEDKAVLLKRKTALTQDLIELRNTVVNASADSKAKMRAFDQLEQVRDIEILNYCCGVDGFADYKQAGFPIPSGCCIVKNCDVNVEKNLYFGGCYEYLKTYVFTKAHVTKKTVFPIKVMTRNLAILIIFTMIYFALIFFSRIWPDTTSSST